MKKKLFFCACAITMVFSAAAQQTDTATICRVLHRYREFLLRMDTSAEHNKVSGPDATGRWNDINYGSNEAGKWQVADHLHRTRLLALAWANPASPLYGNPAIQKNIALALADWVTHRYKSSNWWHNEIGVPQLMRDILVLVKDDLSAVQFRQCLEIMAQYKLNGTGANLAWSADLGLHYGALTGNSGLMKICSDTLQAVIQITTQEGIQPDYSFHQHGKRLQVYHYGGAFLLDNMRLAWELRGTPLAFSTAKINLLTNFVLNCWQWMARGINTVPGTIDRAASRTNALHSADIRTLIPFFIELQPGSAAAFKKLLAVQQGSAFLQGYRYFPSSDFTAYQQPAFSFFLKTNSTRTLLTESINGENLKGGMLNNGDSYFLRNGLEYFNLAPVWDWQRLPGITNFISNNQNKTRQTVFTGNASDQQSGIAVMEEQLLQNGQQLRARKCWINHKNTMIALVAGLHTDSLQQPAFTVMDQCRWQGSVFAGSVQSFPGEGQYAFSKLSWVYHNQFVYLPLYKDSVEINLQRRTGRWSNINASEPSVPVYDSVFMPVIVHRKNDTLSGYAVVFAATLKQAVELQEKRGWQVLQNNSNCQAVAFGDGTVALAIYRAAAISLVPTGKIVCSRPCAMLIKAGHIFVSDPAHTGGVISGRLNGRSFSALLPADGTTVEAKLLPAAAR